MLRNLCFQKEKRFVHDDIGWNYRMTNLQAALGLGQFENLENNILKKIKIGETYNKHLSEIPFIKLPLRKTTYASNIYWVYGILLEKKLGFFNDIQKKLCSEDLYEQGFYIPSGLTLNEEKIAYVVKQIKKLVLG